MKNYTKKLLMLGLAVFTVACNTTPDVYNATTSGKEILTPASKDVPQINGASVFGVRPGKPVFYKVAVSGIKPITYAAEGLPKEVQIDAATGWITGRAPEKISDYEIWAKDLADGSKAVAFFNLSDEEQNISISAEKLGKKGKVRDLWRQQDIGKLKTNLSIKVSPHGTAFFKVK